MATTSTATRKPTASTTTGTETVSVKPTNKAPAPDARTLYEIAADAAADAVDVWLAAKARYAKLPQNASVDRNNSAGFQVWHAKDAAVQAIRRLAWVDGPFQPTNDDLINMTPVFSFIHPRMNWVFIATTGAIIGDVVSEQNRTADNEILIGSPIRKA